MSLDRRAFVRTGLSGAALIAAGVPVLTPRRAQAAQHVRTRIEMADQTTIDALKKGVKVMMDRQPSDPKSWFFQASVHGVSDDNIAAAVKKDPKVANVDRKRFWNQCPHGWDGSTVYSAEFIIWHRAYVYYFERILREASGYDGLALPYWNYTDPEQRALPDVFADPKSPLFDATRDPSINDQTAGLSPKAVDTTAAFKATNFFDTSTQAFGGSPTEVEYANQGLAERRPHNQVHRAIKGDMLDPATAALDPIFWVHHCNIDRLWNLWACLPNRSWGNVPTAAWLNATPWAFYDADAKVKTESRVHWLAPAADLGIRFDTDDAACRPMKAPAPAKSTRHTIDLLLKTGPAKFQVGTTGALQLGTGATTRTIPLAANKLRGASNTTLFAASSPERLVLELDGVSSSDDTNVSYEVYAGLPKGTPPDPKGRYFVGTVDFFHVHHHGSASAQYFDITSVARAPGFSTGHLDLTFVPFDLLTPVKSGASIPRRAHVTIHATKVHAVAAQTF
jgi:tyrosinase-like protein